MLGRTAGGLFWLSRYLERSENTARLVDAGFRMALTRARGGEDEWGSVLSTVGCLESYEAMHEEVSGENVIDYLLREPKNPMSIYCAMSAARENARAVRTALTREVWEAVNSSWMSLKDRLAAPVSVADLPSVLSDIRQQSALVRGSLHGTMLRNDIFHFSRIGALIERADNTARILDVKYYVLLPTGAAVGASFDNVQWEMVLRSASAERSFHWLHPGQANSLEIARFLMMDPRMPRSLTYCYDELIDIMSDLQSDYGDRRPCHDLVQAIKADLAERSIETIVRGGLHEFLEKFLDDNARFAAQLESDYRFHE